MKYNFDKIINRRNTDSVKWNCPENELPMWIADMDFEVADEIKEAVNKRASHSVYAYTDISDEWYNAYINWWGTRHGLAVSKENIIFSAGVVPTISSVVRKLTTPAEKVLIQTPVYNIFFNSILNNGREVLESELKYDGEKYEIDFADLEAKLSDPQTSLMIVCNPHNPVGKIWDKATLAKIGELCKKHDVTVISDEIHCDLVAPGHEYVPFASASDICREISITCVAPSKTFNIAGLHTSAVFVYNPALRHKVWRGLNTDEVGEPNVFAVPAAIAALEHGAEWLDELREYVWESRKFADEFIKREISKAKIIKADATYLLWIDLSEICDDVSALVKFVYEKTGLRVCPGAQYGNAGKNFIRVNIACPRALVEDGLTRLKNGIELFIDK